MSLTSRLSASAMIFSISLSTIAHAQTDRNSTLLPEEQALALQNAIESGDRLTVYDKAFLFWTVSHLGAPDCGLIDAQEHNDLEILISETAVFLNFLDASASMQAQKDFYAEVPRMAATANPCSIENRDESRKLLEDIVNVLTNDNKGSRSDLKDYLEDNGVLPKEDEPIPVPQGPLSAPLYKAEILPLGRYNVDPVCLINPPDGSKEVCDKVLALVASRRFETVRCVYGPFNQDGSGYESYPFWYQAVPEDLAAYEIPGGPHPLGQMGKAAVAECPADSRSAMQIQSSAP